MCLFCVDSEQQNEKTTIKNYNFFSVYYQLYLKIYIYAGRVALSVQSGHLH